MAPEIAETRDQNTLSKTFPSEVWLMILKVLIISSNACLENVSNFYFWHLLGRKRNLWLLPKAWNLLAQHAELVARKTCKNWKQFRAPYEAIIKVRMVSRRSCHTFDTYCRNIDRHFKDGKLDWDGFIRDKSLFIRVLQHQNQIDLYSRQFMEHFSATHQNTIRSPFITNSVFIVVAGVNPTLLRFLQIYGKHIFHCRIKIWRGNIIAGTMRGILLEMPNLKYLQVHLGNEMKQSQVQRLEDGFRVCPFPSLSTLEVLCLPMNNNPIFKELLRVNSHATIKEISN